MRNIILISILMILAVTCVAEDMKFAIINADRILEVCKDGKRVKGILNALQEEWNNQLVAKEAEYKAAYDEYMNMPEMVTDDFRKEKENQLIKLEGEYTTLQKTINSKANKKQDELLMPIFEKLGRITEELSIERNYRAIFDMTLSGFVYVDSTLDVTEIVIQKMDEGVE
ncbi:MAG: OmpH family outer membrane protein [Candidatus Cloacimonetes bacterium]|nr:OmpH family outer membrane protein [Candidatus Cloacimonadota bacterium]